MPLPQKLPLELMQTRWATLLNPLLVNPIFNGLAINEIILDAGVPKAIQTNLGQVQVGWFITDQLSNSNIWRTEPLNDKTLTLQADNDTTISLWVF